MPNLKAANRRLAQRADYHIGDVIRTRWLWRYLQPLLDADARRVLDAGAGAGQHALEVAKRYPQADVLGLDNRPEAIQVAQAEVQATGLRNLHFSIADLTQPLADGDFDVIYSIDVIEHIDNDRAMLRNLAQALRPGGHLLIHTPLTPQRHFFHRFDLDRNVNKLHVREGYRRGELEAKAQEAGLTVERSVFTHAAVGTLAWEVWRIVRPWAVLKTIARPFLMALAIYETNRLHDDGNCILLAARKEPGSVDIHPTTARTEGTEKIS